MTRLTVNVKTAAKDKRSFTPKYAKEEKKLNIT